MEIVSVLVAAAAAYGFGAVWYMTLSKPWIAASGVPVNEKGHPANSSITPFILSAIAALLVAGMMRHVFGMAGIDSIGKGLLAGLGLGAFVATPWTMINNAYGGRPAMLTVIDGGHTTIACGIIGAVLGLI